MFDETLLWILLGVLTLTTIALVIGLVRTRHKDDDMPGGQHAATASHPATEPPRMPSPHGQPAAAPRPAGGPTSASLDQGDFSVLRMNHEERARLLAAASHYDPRDRPSPPPAATPSPAQAPVSAATSAPAPFTSRAALGSSFTPAPPPPGVIRGYVRQAAGAVISGASLTLIDLAGGQIGRGETGGDGAYSLPTPSPGSYFLIARARGHHPQASTVTVTDQPVTLSVVLTGLAELSGVVRIAGGNEPVPSALVTLLDVRGEVIGSTSTDHHGRYHFAELVGGSYTLAASASPFRPMAHHVTVSDTGASVHDIELLAGAYLQGTVVAGRDRRAFPDARVTLYDPEGNVVAVTSTDSAGEYLFADVPEGEYTLNATSYPAVSLNLRVSGGQKHEQNVELNHPED